jgi:hypothetical protein
MHTVVVTQVKQVVLEFTEDEWDDMQAEGDILDVVFEIAENESWTTVDRSIEEV